MKNTIDFRFINTSSDPYADAFNKRIIEVIKVKADSSPELFCMIIGIPYKENNPLTIDIIFKIKDKYPNLSLNWLLMGEGEMEDKDLALAAAEIKAKIKIQEGSLELIQVRFKEMKDVLKNMQSENAKDGFKVEKISK